MDYENSSNIAYSSSNQENYDFSKNSYPSYEDSQNNNFSSPSKITVCIERDEELLSLGYSSDL